MLAQEVGSADDHVQSIDAGFHGYRGILHVASHI